MDIRYATEKNVTWHVLYSIAGCFLHGDVAERLALVQKKLIREGYELCLRDGYRPHHIQQQLLKYISNPRFVSPVSHHSRGIAIDCTLTTNTNAFIPMQSDFDTFDATAHPKYMVLENDIITRRAYLHRAMESSWFAGDSDERWHFDYLPLANLPPLDIPFR